MNFLISDNENQWMCKELDASLSLHVVSRICLFWPYFWACELVDRCFSIESCCLQRAVTIRLILQVRGFFVQGKKSCRVVDHFFVFAFRVVMLFFSEVKTLVDTSRLSSSYGHMEYIALHILSIHSPLGMLLLLSISDCFKEMASFPYQTSSALSILCVFSLF